MANQRTPNDPYRSGLSDDDFDRAARLDKELQPDPELAEGPAGSGRFVLFAVGIALVLGAVFYGLNHQSTNQASTAPPAKTAQTQPAPPQAPPGIRDVTPHPNNPNSQPGTTTGAAPPQPQMPPATAPTNMSHPPTGNAPDNK